MSRNSFQKKIFNSFFFVIASSLWAVNGPIWHRTTLPLKLAIVNLSKKVGQTVFLQVDLFVSGFQIFYFLFPLLHNNYLLVISVFYILFLHDQIAGVINILILIVVFSIYLIPILKQEVGKKENLIQFKKLELFSIYSFASFVFFVCFTKFTNLHSLDDNVYVSIIPFLLMRMQGFITNISIDVETVPIVDEKKVPIRKTGITQRKDVLEEKRERIMKEFLETEKTYVRDLHLLNERFLLPCKFKKIIKEKELLNLFDSVESVIKINDLFLKKLTNAMKHSNRGGDEEIIYKMILHFAQTFKLYFSFMSNYKVMMGLMHDERKKNKQFRKFVKESEEKLKIQGYRACTLDAFLITVVQRLPRYQLLLNELLKNTLEKEKKFTILKKAHSLIQEVTFFCNYKVRESQNLRNLKELKKELKINNLISSNRKFFDRQKKLKVSIIVGNKKKKDLNSVSCFLFDDMIVMTYKPFLKKSKKISLENYKKKEECRIVFLERQMMIEFHILIKRKDGLKFVVIKFSSMSIYKEWKSLIL